MGKKSIFLAMGLVSVLGASHSLAGGLFVDGSVADGLVDYATPPDQVADAIVIYTPKADMPLSKMESFERVFIGQVDKQEKGSVVPSVIVHKANSMIMPLQTGVPVRLYLKRFSDRDAYYPIAIFPVSSGVK